MKRHLRTALYFVHLGMVFITCMLCGYALSVTLFWLGRGLVSFFSR